MPRNSPSVQQLTSHRGAPLPCRDAVGCDICNEPLTAGHEHVLDTEYCAVICLCLACSEVFRHPRSW